MIKKKYNGIHKDIYCAINATFTMIRSEIHCAVALRTLKEKMAHINMVDFMGDTEIQIVINIKRLKINRR